MANTSLLSTIFSGALWNAAISFVRIFVQVGVIIYLSRILTPAEFGLITAASIVIELHQVVAQMGVDAAIIQKKNISQKLISAAFIYLCITGLLFTGAIIFFSPMIEAGFKIENLSPVIRTMSVCIFVNAVSLVSQSLLLKEFQFKKIAQIQLFSFLVGYALTSVIAATLGLHHWSLAIAFIAQTVISSISTLILRPVHFNLNFHFSHIKELIRFGAGISFAKLWNFLALRGDNWIVGRFLGVGPLGHYNRAYQIMSIPTGILAPVFDKVLFASFSRFAEFPEKIHASYIRAIALISILLIPMGISVHLLAEELVGVLLGDQWQNTVPLLRILALCIFFRTGYKLCTVILKSLGMVWLFAVTQVTYAVFILLGAGIGSRWGIDGVATGILCALSVQYLAISVLTVRKIQYDFRKWIALHLRITVSSSILCLFIWGVIMTIKRMGLPSIVTLLTGFGAYFISVILLSWIFAKIDFPELKWWFNQLQSVLKKKNVR